MEAKELANNEESLLTMKDVWKALKKRFIVVLAIIVGCAALGAAFSYFFVKTQRTSKASLIVTVEPTNEIYTIIVGDKEYTVKSGSVLDSEIKADGYAKTLANDYVTLLDYNNEIVYRKALEKYKEKYPSKTADSMKLDHFTRTFGYRVDGSTILFSYVSDSENPDRMLQCVVDAFTETIGDSDGGKNIFGISGGKITVLSAPSVTEESYFSKIVKYALIFALLGVAASVFVVVITAVKTKKQTTENKN